MNRIDEAAPALCHPMAKEVVARPARIASRRERRSRMHIARNTCKKAARSARFLGGASIAVAVIGTSVLAQASPASADTSSPQSSPLQIVGTGSGSPTSTALGSGQPAPTAKEPTTTTTTPKSVAHSGAGLNGVGSSFAAPAIETFDSNVGNPPYSITVNYSSTSSGDGRYEFTNATTDFAVSDIAYGLGSEDANPPSFPYIYVPITAAGIAFMYNIPGLSKNLQLNSYTTCAILTGAITNWNDPHIAAQNPGVSLPNLTIRPMTESDAAGTNYVLEEWCIDEQPALWSAFANFVNHQAGNNTPISPTAPESEWPPLSNGYSTSSTAAVASNVVNNAGGIGAVQQQYAKDVGFGQGNPAQGVASEQNASGDYTQPSPAGVASALAYATQLPNGTHQLNFGGVGAHVYNPSTYSYLLTPTKGWSCTKGTTMSKFVNYSLTLGQKESPNFFYASLGLSLERYGVTSVINNVPCSVPVTAAEQASYSCGDLTPSEVAAGQTTPTCGVLNSSDQAPLPPGSSANGLTSAGGAGGANGAGGAGANGAGGAGANGAGGAGSLDPSVSLSGSTPLAFTGGDPRPVVIVGLVLLAVGWFTRRRLLRSMRTRRVEDQK